MVVTRRGSDPNSVLSSSNQGSKLHDSLAQKILIESLNSGKTTEINAVVRVSALKYEVVETN